MPKANNCLDMDICTDRFLAAEQGTQARIFHPHTMALAMCVMCGDRLCIPFEHPIGNFFSSQDVVAHEDRARRIAGVGTERLRLGLWADVFRMQKRGDVIIQTACQVS